jgi:hypothetical protein
MLGRDSRPPDLGPDVREGRPTAGSRAGCWGGTSGRRYGAIYWGGTTTATRSGGATVPSPPPPPCPSWGTQPEWMTKSRTPTAISSTHGRPLSTRRRRWSGEACTRTHCRPMLPRPLPFTSPRQPPAGGRVDAAREKGGVAHGQGSEDGHDRPWLRLPGEGLWRGGGGLGFEGVGNGKALYSITRQILTVKSQIYNSQRQAC